MRRHQSSAHAYDIVEIDDTHDQRDTVEARSMPAAAAAALGSNEWVQAWCYASPTLLHHDPLPGHRPRSRFARTHEDLRRHIGGRRGSIARTVPRDRGWFLVLVLSADRVTMWDLGLDGAGHPDEPVFEITRAELTSIETRRSRGTGIVEVRMRFADKSFLDIDVLAGPELVAFLLSS